MTLYSELAACAAGLGCDDDENCVNDDDDEYLYVCNLDNSISIISVLLKGWIGRPANIC